MAYEFQKLADVEAVEEFPEEGASVLIEHEGGIKKCPADGIGGGGSHIYRFARDVETETVAPLEECSIETLKADLEGGLAPMAVIMVAGVESGGDFDITVDSGIVMPLASYVRQSAYIEDYGGDYETISIKFCSTGTSYNLASLDGSYNGLVDSREIFWSFDD